MVPFFSNAFATSPAPVTGDPMTTALTDSDAEERKAFLFNPFDDAEPQSASLGGKNGRSSSSSSSFSMLDFKAALPSPSLPQHMQSSTVKRRKSSAGSSLSVASQSTPSVPAPPATEDTPTKHPAVSHKATGSFSSSHSVHSVIAAGAALSKQPSTMSFNSSRKTQPPVAGFRIPASGSATLASFPLPEISGPAFRDTANQPIYVCSAILGTSVHPAKCGPHLNPPVRWTFAGQEVGHDGRYDLLPITPEMRWIKASGGQVPEGYVPVQGGYEESGEKLHHALGKIEGCWVPGKAGEHLLGANFPWHNTEVRMKDGYRLLCWVTYKTA